MDEELQNLGTTREQTLAAGIRFIRAARDLRKVLKDVNINIDDIPWDQLGPVIQQLLENCPKE